jgi:hypothetical protein
VANRPTIRKAEFTFTVCIQVPHKTKADSLNDMADVLLRNTQKSLLKARAHIVHSRRHVKTWSERE